MIKKIIALTVLTLTQPSFAKSTDILIPGGTIDAASMFPITVSKLIPFVRYNLNCSLINPNEKAIVFVIANKGSRLTIPYLDNVFLNGQAKLTPGTHELKLENVTQYESEILLVNADEQNSMLLDSCVAVADENV